MNKSIEDLAKIAVDTGFHLHENLGPGMLESVYEMVMFEQLVKLGLHVERQRAVRINYDNITIENAFRIDLLIEDQLIVEIKSVDQHAPVHAKQLLTYLRLMNLPLGLLMNFGCVTFKEGVRRLANNHIAP